ncbi:Putative E3 SUMO-protein ligase Nse2 (Mms21) [Septoria linicola]|uniref:E3 SUMO-protein ligase Nse2 (Mms21) n=1 Tax=Septoria linicola TaxID=215465 RepID=A0A9Q9ACZ0_9PEZI|nr:putative E3 SUMO-protein ligase Nse2 (Mms21) [Septoria linicola]USW47269.1 Putative E3 SUMO-protein ligase Nse2 (Mms21) [Septoria linicola]
MPARTRYSTATPGPTTARTISTAATLPDYQPPAFALNPDAQRAIADLLRKHNSKKLEADIHTAQEQLTNTGAELHDKLHEHETRLATRRGKQSQSSPSDEFAAFEQQVNEMRSKVESMATRMEKEMRALIDCGVSARAMQDGVAAAEADAKANASTQASTQHTQTQRRTRRRDGEAEDDDEDDDAEDDRPHWDPTDPAGASQRPPVDVFDKHVQNTKDRFQAMSLYNRYAENEAYINFKQVLFDAQNPNANEDGQAPDASQWFAEGGVPPPGTRQDIDNAESDDDIAIVSGQISIKCPLTLKEFEDPLSSKKCKHTFEAAAIHEMIANSTMRPKAVQCPVPGCSAVLEKNDLHQNKLLIRRIRRVQKAKRLREEAGDDSGDEMPNGTQSRGHVIDDDDDDIIGDDDDDDDDSRSARPQVKPEPKATGSTSQHPAPKAPGGTQVIDLGESDEEDVDMEG